MKAQLSIIATAAVLAMGLHGASSAAESAKEKADAAQINSACAEDAKKTGCSGETFGKGLMKCMRAYKAANKSFKHSQACEAAIKQMQSEEKSEKAEKTGK
jgi:hypothetical protein